jgi:ABC-type lipoprotein export system ATPase subunit
VQLVRVRGVSKTFGTGQAATRVLDGVDVSIEEGELVAILGRSGTGKSTLINLIGGIDRPDSGTIVVAGADLAQLDERGLTEYRRRQVGFIFQLFHLIPELTGAENVLMPARLTGAAPDAPRRARELLARLELDGAADQLPHTLSGGEQQRIAIARALVNDARLILADEPTGNLDPDSGARVLEILRSIAAGQRSVVLVTHDEQATAVADRVLELAGGRLRER